MTICFAPEESRAYRWIGASATGRLLRHGCCDGAWASLERSHALRMVRAVSVPLYGITVLLGIGAAAVGMWGALALVLAFLLARTFPVVALGCVPTLLIWAPKLSQGIAGDEALSLRLDQAVIAGMALAAMLERQGALRTPPAHGALVVFLALLAISIIVGTTRQSLTTPVSAVLYLGQWLTWYGLYLAAWTYGSRLAGAAFYGWAVPLILLAAYGLAEWAWPLYAEPGVRYRTFERGWFPGQANHAGGLLAMAAVSGVALTGNPRFRGLGVSLALLATAALPATGSRSGYLAWAAGMVALVLILRPRLRWWLPPIGVLGLCALPRTLWQEVSAPGSSMYDRLVAWKSALSTVPDFPLIGLGAGARHRSYYDNQYVMTLAESGLLGLGALLILLLGLAATLAQARRAWASPLGTGALAALAAVATHSMATGSLIVTMVGGPLFWVCGVAARMGARP